jgi:hypothetical protein
MSLKSGGVEVQKPPEQTTDRLSYSEAVVAAKAGRRVRGRGWYDESYGRWIDGELRAYVGNRESTCPIPAEVFF